MRIADCTAGRRLASIVSLLFNPMIVGIPVILLIGVQDTGEIRMELLPVILLCVGIMCVLPLIYVVILMKTGLVRDFHITDRRQRIYLFPFVLVCMVAVVYIVWTTEGVSPLVRNMLAVGLFLCLACAVITIRFKISLHCAGLSWLVVGLFFSFGVVGGLLGLAGLCLAAWSRLVLREHEFSEVAAGSVFGLLSTWLCLGLAL